MKRSLWMILMVLMATTLWAKGTGDGTNKNNAIEFDWAKGITIPNQKAAIWYRINLANVSNYEQPNLVLNLTNPSTTDSLKIAIALYYGSSKEERSYTIAPKSTKIWSASIAILQSMGITEVYLEIVADVAHTTEEYSAAIEAKLDETEDIQDACLNAQKFTGNATAAAGAERWYSLDLSEIGITEMYVLTYQNTGAAEAVVTRQLSPTCPVSSPATRTLTVPAGASVKDTLNRAMLTLLGKNPYLGIETTRNIKVSGEIVTAINGNAFDACSANIPEAETWYDIAAGTDVYNYYKINRTVLLKRRFQPQISFSNDSNAIDATVKVEFVINGQCNGIEYTTHIVTIPAGETGTLDIARDMVMAIDTTVDYVYARISTTQPNMQAMWRMKHLHEGVKCKYATTINWAEKVYPDVDTEVWYEIDIATAKANTRDLVATIINRSASKAKVHGEIAFVCPSYDTQEMTRTMKAGDTITKIIPYSSFSSIASDQVWFGIQANQAVSFMIDTVVAEPLDQKESEACLEATLFDWTYGHVQNANDTVWYKLPMDTLRKAVNKDMLPYFTLSNRGNTSGTFHIASTDACPAKTAYSEREKSIAGLTADTTFISTDMIKKTSTDIDTFYIRVIGTQEFSFQIKMLQQEEGAVCSNAIPFNWVTGNDHTANDTLWYRLDLTEAKNSDNDLEIVLINRSAVAGTARGELATVCPCLTTEKKKFSMKAGATKRDTIPHATIETFGDTLWIKLAADVNLHFEAHLIEPAPFDTIYACNEATKLEYDKDYRVADSAWFYVLTDTAKHTPLVPEVKLTNGATAQDIKAEIAYHCPVTATMMTQTSSLRANRSKTKILERSTAESMAAAHDTIWVRVSGSKHSSFTFRVDLVDPNDGHDCAHAMYLQPDTAFVQNVESSLWYYLDREDLTNNHQYLEVSYKNLDAKTDYAEVLVFGDCENVKSPIFYLSHDELMASSSLTDTLTPAVLSRASGQYIYLNIQTGRQDSIRLKAIAQPALTDTIWACDKATHIVPNTTYNLNAGDTAWYQLNVRNLRENYTGNATMTVTNLNMEEDMNLQVYKSWECPIVYEPINTLLVVEDSIKEHLSMKDLAKMDSDIVYVRLIPNQNMLFRLNMNLAAGGQCDGIVFDWDNGNVHPGGNDFLWYDVKLDTARIGLHDLRLWIENLSADTIKAECYIHADCMDPSMASVSYTFAPDSSKYKDIDRDLIISSRQERGTWSIQYRSTNTTRIWVELIPEAADKFFYDTIRAEVCNQSIYEDLYTPEGKDPKHTIDADDESTLMWNDTISFQEGTYLIDSVITVIITPIVDPQILTLAQLDSLGALPICKQGMALFTDTATAILERYYDEQAKASKYPVATINRIYWTTHGTNSDGDDEYTDIHTSFPKTSILGKEQTHIYNVSYALELNNCNNDGSWTPRSEDTTLVVEPWRIDSVILRDTVCVGTSYEFFGGNMTITEDCRIPGTKHNITVKDALKQDRMVDSAYIYYLTVWKKPLVQEINTFGSQKLPTAKIGEAINNTRITNDLNTYYLEEGYTHYPVKDTAGVSEIIWQQKINNGEFELLDKSYKLACGDTLIGLRYGIVSNCNDTIWSDGYTFHSEHSLTDADPTWEVRDTICHNGSIVIGGVTITEAGNYNDTIVNACGCDTVVTHIVTKLQLYVPLFDEDSAYVVCGQPVHVEAITAAVQDSIANNPLLAAHYQSMTWEIQKGNEAWAELGTDELDARYDAVSLRLTIHSECGDTAYEFLRDLEPASAENVAEFNTLPAESMFGDRILMINLNEIMELLGDTVKSDEVHWHHVMGQQDYIEFIDGEPKLIPADADDVPDSLVATGYYYTLPEAETLKGSYYALVARQFNIDPIEGTCGYAMRTVVIETQASKQAPVRHKVIDRGNVVIITEEDDRYDTNGRKL